MLRSVRLFWICLLVMALPFKAWALVSGVHCSSTDPASPPAVVMTHSDTGVCPHHLDGTDGSPLAEPAAAQEGGDAGHHSCSACAHCSTAPTLPSAWPSFSLVSTPHTPPASVIRTWCSAAVPTLDRPPTHVVV